MIEPLDPERLDLTSASDAHARRRCPGRTRLIKHLRSSGKLKPNGSPDASFGDQIHAAWAGQSVTLDPFQTETLEKMRRLESMLLSDWASGREVALFAPREQRLWLHQGITPLHSGQYDVAYVTTDFRSMLIIDGKTLTHTVAPADTNDQLRELVALAHFNYPAIQTFTVAIVQPHVDRPATLASYDQLEAELALRLLRWHLNDIQQPDLPRIYGEWCRYCPAIDFCPEARAAIPPILATQDNDSALALPIGPDGARFIRQLTTAKHLCETLLGSYKAFLAEHPHDIPGFTLKPGKSKRALANACLAFAALKDFVPQEDFLAACNLSVTKLQSAFGDAQNLKGKALRDAFNARLADVIEFKTDAPSLEDTES